MSGSVTISSSGVPARLKSTSEALGAGDAAAAAADVDRLPGVLLEVRARDRRSLEERALGAERLVVLARSGSPSASRDRSSSCGRTSSARGIRQPSASPTRSAWSTASRFSTGSIPGCARQTGQTLVFGASPKRFRQRQNIFVAVAQLHVDLEPDHRLPVVMPAPPVSRGGTGVEADRLLERVADLRAAGSRRTPGRSPGTRPAARRRGRTGSTGPGRPARLTGSVNMSFGYIASGSSSFAPIGNATVGAVGRAARRSRSNASREVAADQRADALRLPVVGVVVAGRQRVGAEHDPALHLGAEARAARLARTSRARRRRVDAQAVADAVVARQVRGRLGRRDQVVGGQAVRGVRQRRLADLGAERPAQRRRCARTAPRRRARRRRRAGRAARRGAGPSGRSPTGSSIGSGRPTLVESRGSSPAMIASSSATSRTVGRERPDLVERRRERDHAVARDARRTSASGRRRRRTPPAGGSSRRCRCRASTARGRPRPPRPSRRTSRPAPASGSHGLRVSW